MLQKKICTLLFLIFHFITNSQNYNPDNINKKAVDLFKQALEETNVGDYLSALKNLNKSVEIEPKFTDAYLSKADIYANQNNYDSAQINFEMATQIDSNYTKQFLLPYSQYLAATGKFNSALQAVTTYINSNKLNKKNFNTANYRKNCYQFAADFDKKKQSKNYAFTPVNLGDSVNSIYSEYYPSLTIDGGKLIFTRRINDDEDFYETNFKNGKWSKAIPLPGNINTNLKEGALCISQDGQCIVYAGYDYPKGLGNFDLYIAYKTFSGWSEPENLGPLVNTDFWESSPSLSPDKKDLYFSSSRAGGFGGKDIWVTHRNDKGHWSRPENLGAAVNTSGDESCPFMHADNETLYFNSNGHQGYGGTDLFYTKKVNDTSWLEAENLGYPINTIFDEGSLIVAADAKTAYFASDRNDTKGGLDLYTFNMPQNIRPLKTLWVKGKIFDAKTLFGLSSSVELTDLKTQQIISRLQTDKEGNYLTTLPIGKNYAFNVNKKGYLFFSENFSLWAINIDSTYTKDIALQPIEIGAKIILKNIFFELNKFNLKSESIIELNKIVLLLKENPNLKILITGHTDNIGAQKDNLLLSNNRAKSVVNYLVSKGINLQRLSYTGYGATKPISNNTTEAGKAMNRRTELSIISN